VSESYPSFERNDQSPPLPPRVPGKAGAGSAVALALSGSSPKGTIVRGAYRVTAEDRATLAPGPLRPRVFLFVLGREVVTAWIGRPGGEAAVFAGEEPPTGDIEGWFNVVLEDCCRMSNDRGQFCDIVAVLGPWKSAPVELRPTP